MVSLVTITGEAAAITAVPDSFVSLVISGDGHSMKRTDTLVFSDTVAETASWDERSVGTMSTGSFTLTSTGLAELELESSRWSSLMIADDGHSMMISGISLEVDGMVASVS